MALVLTRLVRSNYDELDNIPIIHQDLTASFTKQANTYYIHTGSNTSAYTKGRMYYCDGTNLKKVVIVDELPATPNNGKLTITVNGTAHTFTANQAGDTSFSITNTDTGMTSVEVTGSGNAVTAASYNASTRKLTLTKGTTFLTAHQVIKTLNTNNTTAQTANSNEAIIGSGMINLHKVAKTGIADKVVNGLTLGGGVVYDGSKAVSISSGDHVSITGGPNGISIGLGHSVMPSTYNKVTVDGYGIVTGGENVNYLTSDGSVKSVIDYNDTSKKIKIGYAGTGISGDGIKYIAGYTAGDSESEAKIKDISKDALKSWLGYAAVATSGSYNDLSDKPSFDKLTRIQKQAYTGGNNTVQYFKLASFPVYNNGGNYASFIITGRMGGWQADNMSFVNMILYNRNGEGGGYINVANSAFFNLCDIVMYREEDGTSTAYLKVKSYYTFDINVNTYQATNVYTGTDVTPTGALKWTASTQADRLAVSGGVAYVNGFTLPKQIKINGTTHNPDSNGLVDLGTTPIKSASLNSSTKTLTLTLS